MLLLNIWMNIFIRLQNKYNVKIIVHIISLFFRLRGCSNQQLTPDGLFNKKIIKYKQSLFNDHLFSNIRSHHRTEQVVLMTGLRVPAVLATCSHVIWDHAYIAAYHSHTIIFEPSLLVFHKQIQWRTHQARSQDGLLCCFHSPTTWSRCSCAALHRSPIHPSPPSRGHPGFALFAPRHAT